ncbi:MAG TPA: hydantoinase/oxoprolinase family protein [Candidatus Methylomirabilis sp.]
MRRVGIDIGGTFTDFYVVDGERVETFKRSSTPDDPARAALEGLRALEARFGLPFHQLEAVAHGTTVATNAMIQRRGARMALVATRGFRDVLELGRLTRPPDALYNIQYEKPPELVPRHMIFEVDERVDAQGRAVRPLRDEEVARLADRLKAAGAESVSVALLFSFQNPSHERRIREGFGRLLPGVPVYLSSEILPEIREFDRTSTTVISGYLGPLVVGYMERMLAEIRGPRFYLMQSNGGLTTLEMLRRRPASLIASGPAAGVVAAAALGEAAGEANIISVDMGGTSCDVSLIRARRPVVTTETHIGKYPLKVPAIDIQSVGAGGGSVAWLDGAKALRVGPHSAGAVPGPACYGRGGEQPTVTDANLAIGLLNPDNFAGGGIRLERARAEHAIQARVAGTLGMSAVEAADGIRRIVNAGMAGAMRVVTVEKGYDPRDCVLMAFGGAGPVHALDLAAELEIPRVIVPRYPGVTCALGLTLADVSHDYVQTLLVDVERLEAEVLNRRFGELEEQGHRDLGADGVPGDRQTMARSADLRYIGQGYHLNAPVAGGALDGRGVEAIREAFHAAHEATYGFRNPGEPVEIVNIRVTATGRLDKPAFPAHPVGGPDPFEARTGTRDVYSREHGGWAPFAVYDRAGLRPGNVVGAPAIVEQPDSTTVIPPAHRARVDAHLNLIIEKT